jgi:fucose 4-O-acetylase-like acetyltransferase
LEWAEFFIEHGRRAEMTAAQKNAQIQSLRGLACILLVLYHVVGDSPSSGLRVSDGPVRWLNDGLAYLRMPLFTFLSGWVYALRPFQGDLATFMSGKARRLLIPMLFVGTIFALLQTLVPGSNTAVHHWYLLHIEPVAHFWYVESLLWIFLGVALLDKWGNMAKPWGFVACFVGVVVLYLTVGGPNILGINGAIYLAPYFLLGLALSRFDVWVLITSKGVTLVMISVALFAIFLQGEPKPNPERRTMEVLLASLCLSVLVLRLPLHGAWWAKVGASSYAIYIFHVFFTAASRIGTEKMGLSWLPLQFVIGGVLGIVGPIWVEKWAAQSRLTAFFMLGKSLNKARGQGGGG